MGWSIRNFPTKWAWPEDGRDSEIGAGNEFACYLNAKVTVNNMNFIELWMGRKRV